MALIPFTSNVSDVSTYDGYQFEFRCQRCGNGYRSEFRHSVTGFGGRLATLGGSLLGGEVGSRIEQVGMLAQWDRGGTRGSTNDRRLLEASHDVEGCFVQCRGCAEWVCRDMCFDGSAGCCTRCRPQQSVSSQQAVSSQQQPGRSGGTQCPNCGVATSGRFCGNCGCPVAPPSCTGCGAPTQGTPFCPGCGTPAHGRC